MEGLDWLSLAQDMSQMCEDGNESLAIIKDKELLASQQEPCSIEIFVF